MKSEIGLQIFADSHREANECSEGENSLFRTEKGMTNSRLVGGGK